jgi:hypothetical protein
MIYQLKIHQIAIHSPLISGLDLSRSVRASDIALELSAGGGQRRGAAFWTLAQRWRPNPYTLNRNSITSPSATT